MALMEAGGTDEVGEFVPSDYDEMSIADSASVGSSIYEHSYHNGRRYHRFRCVTALAKAELPVDCSGT